MECYPIKDGLDVSWGKVSGYWRVALLLDYFQEKYWQLAFTTAKREMRGWPLLLRVCGYGYGFLL